MNQYETTDDSLKYNLAIHSKMQFGTFIVGDRLPIGCGISHDIIRSSKISFTIFRPLLEILANGWTGSCL